MVVLDATMLTLLINPDSGVPLDSATNKPVESIKERIAHFVEQHEKAKTKIGIPTPALSEVLVRAGSAAVATVEKIKSFAVFEILPFDEICAIEVALMTKNAIDQGTKKSGSDEPWAKVKYDRQIMAIARVRRATAIYTDDKNLKALAISLGVAAISISDLPLPPEKAQQELPFRPEQEPSNIPTLDEIEELRNAEAAQSNPVG
jgi:hypothetical protein